MLGALLLALTARIEIPMVPVPMTLQTYGVLVLGALLGWRQGAAVIALYLLLGGLGVPVFAGGAAGWQHLTGPTAGYLVGFVLAVVAVGHPVLRARALNSFLAASLVMALGHAVILAAGVVWLAGKAGLRVAIDTGCLPFLLGATLKSVAAGATVYCARGFIDKPPST